MRTLSAVLLCTLLCSCSGPSKTQASGNEPAITVPVARVTRATLARELVLAAEFRPFQEVDLHAKVAGFLKEITVDVGDRVKEGQKIAVLEIPEMANENEQAEAGKRRSDAELTRARTTLQHAEAAHEAAHLAYQRLAEVTKARPNLVARQELDDSMAKDRVTEAEVANAKAAIAAAEQQIQVSQAGVDHIHTLQAYSLLTAPFAGVISKRYADPGALIQAGVSSSTQAMPVVRISEISRLRLVLNVPESAVPRVRVGSPIEVRVGALNRTFVGRVSRFSNRLQAATRTMETEVDVENPTGDLVPGMYADAVVTLERKDRALALPLEAAPGNLDGATVLVVDGDGKLAERKVTLGMQTPDKREVMTGLADGDLVVLGKRGTLKPGDVVRVREAN